MDIVNIQLI